MQIEQINLLDIEYVFVIVCICSARSSFVLGK